ncbi:hypothetical protein J9978_07915 [Chromobacterium violaceum]|uniref:hypothetical protein n=1 Tax=Chromobacterium violaceum TaxID=536 RepID=UPI0009DAFDA1|nr:hypothetical protein [Chromobacterium violaceum]MBP4049423.1 hypothetical protein [Chromobacterium violaceum]OQS28880.1 hypothetical protein B0T41_05825 [Chromobacterium violaceum]
MASALKLGPLLARCLAAQSRCRAGLAQLARGEAEIDREREAVQSQDASLRELLQAQRPAGLSLDRGELFALLRKQAVLRRQRQNLSLQLDALGEKRRQLQDEKDGLSKRLAQWLRKEDKYRRWQQTERRRARLLSLRAEETEQEEATAWKA